MSRTFYSKVQRTAVIPQLIHPSPSPNLWNFQIWTEIQIKTMHARLCQNSVFLGSILTSFGVKSGLFLILFCPLPAQPMEALPAPQTHTAFSYCRELFQLPALYFYHPLILNTGSMCVYNIHGSHFCQECTGHMTKESPGIALTLPCSVASKAALAFHFPKPNKQNKDSLAPAKS